MKTLIIVIDEDGYECLYVDGKSWPSKGEMTVYACDIAYAAGDELVLIRHVPIEFRHERWPDTLQDALQKPAETWTPTARFQDRVLNRDAGGPIPDGAYERFVKGERKLVVREQCWVCGDREDWRVVEAVEVRM